MISNKAARIVAGASAAVILSISASACSGDSAPSEQKIADSIKKEAGKAGTKISDSQAGCIAKVAHKYFKASALKDAVDGKRSTLDANDASKFLKNDGDKSKVTKEFSGCMTSK